MLEGQALVQAQRDSNALDMRGLLESIREEIIRTGSITIEDGDKTHEVIHMMINEWYRLHPAQITKKEEAL